MAPTQDASLLTRTAPGRVLFLLGTIGAAALAGCFGGGDSKQSDPWADSPVADLLPPIEVPQMTIQVDGVIDDWPSTASAVADQHYMYVRFRTDRDVSVQSDTETVQIQIDVDGDPATGKGTSAGLGVDLGLSFSPIVAGEGQTGGARVDAWTQTGRLDSNLDIATIQASELDISVAPTHASRWFEVRIGRHLSSPGALPAQGLFSQGTVRGQVALFDGDGDLLARAEPFSLDVVPASPAPRRISREVPAKSLGAVRMVSYNVENSSPDEDPAAFRRMLRALDPDVICIQEWYDQTPESLQAWFDRELPIDGRWTAITGGGRGVAVVSKLDATRLGDDVLIDFEGEERTVRAVAAMIDAPAGRVAVTSVHLKCCGGPGGREDLIRSAEADGISAMLQDAINDPTEAAIVIAGDYNLVGSTEPMRLMLDSLDSDSSDLSVVDAMVLGDPTLYTWTNPSSSYLPGRLDYVAFADSRLIVENAFVFDPGRFDLASLMSLNLRAADAEASDHRPIVVDFRGAN